MNQPCTLTIAVPIFNMERCLAKNLSTYCDERLFDDLEVILLNNASEDSSKEIAERFVLQYPRIFTLLDRDSRGYGSSINAAMERARGTYFRIVDADDWVNTQDLVDFLGSLKSSYADIALTDYQIVNMKNGEMTPVRASDRGIVYHRVERSFHGPRKTLPSIHNTTYHTELLRSSGFFMQDKIFFVDEEYVILPYLYARSVVYFPYDVYRYQVANPAQSTSPKNRANYRGHREKVLRRLIPAYQEAVRSGAGKDALAYCFERIKNGVGDHFTTLYLYVENRREGRLLAKEWRKYLKEKAPEFWAPNRKKAGCLALFNRMHMGLGQYEALKRKMKWAKSAFGTST